MYHAWALKIAEAGCLIDTILVDETSALTEGEIMPLFNPDLQKIVLFGDRMQLGPSLATEHPESRPSSWNPLAKGFDCDRARHRSSPPSLRMSLSNVSTLL
ncbi:hypothetical protein BDZ88DRAFT_455230 [Geranomyces variabilis]|nr:hypothetical protein BDZ88DRAFT_455230 [Geranomyces variabilis]KAJ3131382.1 hypothetical protein HDU90_008320 [Geranomyces variabilis]